jgi:hypothetical protein
LNCHGFVVASLSLKTENTDDKETAGDCKHQRFSYIGHEGRAEKCTSKNISSEQRHKQGCDPECDFRACVMTPPKVPTKLV